LASGLHRLWPLGPVLAACVGVELYRRQWRPAAVVAGSPWVALKIDEALKRISSGTTATT
jgi:hypothetical protein